MKETINLTPTWSQILGSLLLLLKEANKEGQQAAIEELKNMAALADLYVASQKTEEPIEKECTPFSIGDVMLAFHESRPKGLLVRALEDSADGPDFYTPIDDYNKFLDPLPAMSGLGYGVIWKGGRWEVVV